MQIAINTLNKSTYSTHPEEQVAFERLIAMHPMLCEIIAMQPPGTIADTGLDYLWLTRIPGAQTYHLVVSQANLADDEGLSRNAIVLNQIDGLGESELLEIVHAYEAFLKQPKFIHGKPASLPLQFDTSNEQMLRLTPGRELTVQAHYGFESDPIVSVDPRLQVLGTNWVKISNNHFCFPFDNLNKEIHLLLLGGEWALEERHFGVTSKTYTFSPSCSFEEAAEYAQQLISNLNVKRHA